MKSKGLTVLLIFFLALSSGAQRIFYSEPDRDDLRQMRFEILGKYNNLYTVYKNVRNRHFVCIYDSEMKIKEKTELDFIPERTFNVDVFSNPEQVLLFYQYQKKGIVYSMGVRLDGSGRKISEPMQLDTTEIGNFSDNKVYSVIASDDKQKLMVFKIKNRGRDNLSVSTLLLSTNLIPIRKARFEYELENSRESIADFYLDNDGNFLFSHVSRPGQREYISKAKLSVLATYSDTIKSFPLTLNNVFLDELRIKVDNLNGRYILTSLYSKTRRGNLDGLFAAIINKDLTGPDVEKAIEFNDDFRMLAKGESATKLAFNEYYLKHFIVKKDGGILITGESAYTNSRGNNWNRWDNPWMWGNPYGGFGGGGFWGWNPWNNWGWGGGMGGWGWNQGWGGQQQTRYYTDNVMILSLDKDANLQWNNVVAKSQYDDNSDNMLSYQIMNSGGELLFLYNEWNRRTPMLTGQSLDPMGKIKKEPPLKSLDKGYEFMIRLGKQVSAREMIVPTIYRNSFSFARIEF
jgi:hypothetical protein